MVASPNRSNPALVESCSTSYGFQTMAIEAPSGARILPRAQTTFGRSSRRRGGRSRRAHRARRPSRRTRAPSSGWLPFLTAGACRPGSALSAERRPARWAHGGPHHVARRRGRPGVVRRFRGRRDGALRETNGLDRRHGLAHPCRRAGGVDARPALWSPRPRRATGETEPAAATRRGTRPCAFA